MLKPLVLVRGLNILPLVSHSRNCQVITWKDKIEYSLPVYEPIKGKPKIIIKNGNICVIFRNEFK